MTSTKEKGVQTKWLLGQEKFLSLTEIRQLISVLERRKNEALKKGRKTPVKDWFLICVATETGLRVQEIADLCCGDVQTTENWHAVFVRSGKGGKPRLVRVRKKFIANVNEFLKWKQSHGENIGKNDPFFLSGGRRMCKRALQKSYKRSMEKACIFKPEGVGIHALRHTFASFTLQASNFNLPLVQRQLGHASVKTTEIYTHVFDADLQKAVERLYK